MADTNQSYRGVDIVPLIYVHGGRSALGGHNYDERFDASVKVFRRRPDTDDADVRVFLVSGTGSFTSTGDARRAAIDFARRMIDQEFDLQATSNT